jgi:hypothetical protein
LACRCAPRADVRAETAVARLQGELIPSGEGFGPVDRTHRSCVSLARRWPLPRAVESPGGDAQGRRRRPRRRWGRPGLGVAPIGRSADAGS